MTPYFPTVVFSSNVLMKQNGFLNRGWGWMINTVDLTNNILYSNVIFLRYTVNTAQDKDFPQWVGGGGDYGHLTT